MGIIEISVSKTSKYPLITRTGQILLFLLILVSCKGEDGESGAIGLHSLVDSAVEPPGSNCPNGGLKIISGIDANGNNQLDAQEIEMTEFACNGSDAKTSLTAFVNEPPSINCPNGGLQLKFGIDENENGELEEVEERSMVYLCNGTDANTTLTKITNLPEGTDCEYGGLRIDSGLDTNGNQNLDSEEITNSNVVCNGNEGIKSLINVSTLENDENCFNGGGLIVQSGPDTNSNDILDEEEVSITRTICNGINGEVIEEIRILILSIGGGSAGYSSGYAADIENFNILNWDNATEVYLSATIASSSESSWAIAEMRERPGDVILNSSVITNSTEFTTLISENFIDNIPERDMTLSLYLSSQLTGESISITGKTELIIIQQN
ncbi:DUF7151 family protein [Flagellimonas sp.]|uniref:DUF7151 family protein n=1 Tax=Flagellimonas sp. TaxID=2058762 RepID=UPI003AB6C36D